MCWSWYLGALIVDSELIYFPWIFVNKNQHITTQKLGKFVVAWYIAAAVWCSSAKFCWKMTDLGSSCMKLIESLRLLKELKWEEQWFKPVDMERQFLQTIPFLEIRSYSKERFQTSGQPSTRDSIALQKEVNLAFTLPRNTFTISPRLTIRSSRTWHMNNYISLYIFAFS